jgi:uncharacterized protein (TIGR04255 family)
VSFRNPALIEIFAEAHLEPGSFAPPLFFDVIPALKAIGFSDVEIDSAPVGPQQIAESPEVLLRPPPRIRCWSANRDRLVQLWPDTFAVNRVGKYLGWDDYFQLFRSVHDRLKTTIQGLRVDTLLLQTVDRIAVPIATFTVGKYLQCGGARIPEWYCDTTQAFDITLGKGVLRTDGFNRVLRIAGRPAGNLFTFDITSVFHDVARGRSAEDLLSELHRESNESFYSLVTQTTIDEVMGGVIDHATHN